MAAQSNDWASERADARAPESLTLLTPMLEPSRVGLTASGYPNLSAACRRSSMSPSSAKGGVGKSQARRMRLVASLSIAIAQPVIPLPVNGIPSTPSTACIAPSSPPRPWSAIHALSNDPWRISVSQSPVVSRPWASTPLRSRASRTALPVTSDTSRSADSPPNSTTTRPKSAALVTARRASARTGFTQPLLRPRCGPHAEDRCRNAPSPFALRARSAARYPWPRHHRY